MIQDFIARQRANGFSGFAGTDVVVRLPLPEELLNELLAEAVVQKSEAVQQARLSIQDNNWINLNLTVKKWLLTKNIKLELEVERTVNFAESPKIKIWLSPSQGVLGGLLDLLTNLLGLLPAGIRITGRLIEIDVRVLLELKGFGEFIRYIKVGEIETQSGVINLTVHLAVE